MSTAARDFREIRTDSYSVRTTALLLLALFLFALTLRLLFAFHFQIYYFGELTYSWRDTSSYLLPIKNLIEFGVYQGDLYLEDSKYFRVPTYPTLLGLALVLFGDAHFEYAIAVFQSVLDSISTVLVYFIVRNFSSSQVAGLISSFVYATYPFVILWTPILYTEVINCFLILTILLFVSSRSESTITWGLVGVCSALLLLSKQYLGLILIIPLVSLLDYPSRNRWRLALTFALGAILILGPWVVRNYVHSGQLILLRGESTGLRYFQEDYEAFERFANLFQQDITPLVREVAVDGTLTLNSHPIFVSNHKHRIDEAARLAHECGDTFVQWREHIPVDKAPFSGCKAEVSKRFNELASQFWSEVPFLSALQTRSAAVQKIFLKSEVTNQSLGISNRGHLQKALFAYRVLLLILGIFGFLLLFWSTRSKVLLSVGLAAIALYFYFAVVIVHVEMRYLLSPDLLFTIFASVALIRFSPTTSGVFARSKFSLEKAKPLK